MNKQEHMEAAEDLLDQSLNGDVTHQDRVLLAMHAQTHALLAALHNHSEH